MSETEWALKSGLPFLARVEGRYTFDAPDSLLLFLRVPDLPSSLSAMCRGELVARAAAVPKGTPVVCRGSRYSRDASNRISLHELCER